MRVVSRTNPPVQPIKNLEAPYPAAAIPPAIEIKVAADIQSAAVAIPLAKGETLPPAV